MIKDARKKTGYSMEDEYFHRENVRLIEEIRKKRRAQEEAQNADATQNQALQNEYKEAG